MEKVLRSVIDVKGEIEPDDLQRNLFYLSESKLNFLQEEDQLIWEYIRDFATANAAAPSINSVRDYFEKERKIEVLDRLEEIEATSRLYTKSDFESLIREKVGEQNIRETSYLLKDASHILSNSLKEDGEEYAGYRDALRYIAQRSDDLLRSDGGHLIRSDITEDAEEVRKNFKNTLSNVQNAWGRGTGLDPIDTCCRGVKPGELWVHAGFTGELKTTFALNWAYKTAFIFRYNVYYYSLEMPVEQVRLITYVMHSNHPKFHKMGYEPLSYRMVRDGVDSNNNKMSRKQQEFFELIVDDIEQGQGSRYGHFFVECPDQGATIPHIKNRVELVHQNTPIHLMFIDHFGLVQSHKNLRDYYQELNGIVREAKSMALNFNRGEKIPIVALHQINRNGKKEAEKNDGKYNLRALADANEVERSSDVITYTYLNQEYKSRNETLIGCLKNRDNPQFAPFVAKVDFKNRFINNLVSTGPDGTGTTGFDSKDDFDLSS